jgi:hypothetical protein
MTIKINDSNRANITRIVKYVLPCLDALLSEKNIENIFAKYAPLCAHKVASQQDIINNIFEILAGNDFATFRAQAAINLKKGDLFKYGVEHIGDLEKQDKEITFELIKAIDYCDLNLMVELEKIINTTETNIQIACNNLIVYLNQVLQHEYDSRCSNTYADYQIEEAQSSLQEKNQHEVENTNPLALNAARNTFV